VQDRNAVARIQNRSAFKVTLSGYLVRLLTE